MSAAHCARSTRSGDDAGAPARKLRTMSSPPRQNWPFPVQIIRLLAAIAIAVVLSAALVLLVLVGVQPIRRAVTEKARRGV